MLELLFLGTGNAFAMGGRRQSCYLIQTENTKILLDAGPCLLQAIRENNIEPKEIDYIILSHLHPDHIGGLPYFLLDDKWITKREKPVIIYAPKSGRDAIFNIVSLFYSKEECEHFNNVFEFRSFEIGDQIELDEFKIEGLEAIHSAEPKMMIIDIKGYTIGYSGDTAFHKQSYDKLLNCDIMIHEVSSWNLNIPNHVNFQELLENTPSNANPIYVSHIDNSVLSNKNQIKLPFILANDNMKVLFQKN
jgi:ribonuclease BN (tRNA processing enzyme)